VKSYGANICCSVCSAEPWPSDPTVRASFDLRRFAANGEPAASPAEGEWRCELHRPPKRRVPPAARVTPAEAVTEFERLIAVEAAHLEAALPIDDDDNNDDREAALGDFRREIERGLGELRKAIVPQKPPASLDETPKGRRSPRKLSAKERIGTLDWVTGDAQSAAGDQP
jgi:hypothetical protein